MDSILSGIKGVMVRVDDILVATSGGVTTHVGVIKQVFRRLAKHNVKLNGAKCQFFQAQVKYMGYILSKQGPVLLIASWTQLDWPLDLRMSPN